MLYPSIQIPVKVSSTNQIEIFRIMNEESDASWYVYILRCSDNTLYTGITNDVNRRVSEHNQGRGAKYTRGRLPVELVFVETTRNRSEASRREWAIKQMKSAEKHKIIDQSDQTPTKTRVEPHKRQR